MSSLTDRIRSVVRAAPTVAIPEAAVATADLSALGGTWDDGCYVVERGWSSTAPHGRDRVGDVATKLHGGCDAAAALFAGTPEGTVAGTPLVFFDLETTGLNGGAGTHVFLVGCGWFDDDRFVTRQFVLTRFADERAMLAMVARELERAGALVSFNGKSFDAPLLETRYLFHRLEWIGGELAHIDVLHPARQFWKRDDCSLAALEQHLIGHRRRGDVPGIEIPARYFQFVRTGDAAPLAPVLHHNRLDLLSLAALTARLLDLARCGPEAARTTRESLALGRLYARAGWDERAYEAYHRALALCRAPATAFDAGKVETLRALALSCRHLRRFDEADRYWRMLLDVRGCPAPLASEATEALAIHAEHRLKDLASAHHFATATLSPDLGARRREAVRWRLSRIERKIARQPELRLFS